MLPAHPAFDPVLNALAEMEDPEINARLAELNRLPEAALKRVLEDRSYAVRRSILVNPTMADALSDEEIEAMLDRDPTLIADAFDFEVERVLWIAARLSTSGAAAMH